MIENDSFAFGERSLMNFGILATKLDMLVWTQPNQRFWGDYSARHRTTALDALTHDVGQHRTTPDNSTTPNDVVRCRPTTFTCKLPCRAGVVRCCTTLYDIV